MTHYIIDDHGFGGMYYRCANCGEGFWDILDDIDYEKCSICGEPIDEDANVYMKKGKVEK